MISSEGAGIAVRTDVPYGDLGARLLDIHVPDGIEPGRELPALIHFHGGAWTRGDKVMLARASSALAGMGYAVFNANYRLVKRRKNRWPACWEDAVTALEWVIDNGREYGADPERIGAIGYSAGAHLAALLGTRSETRERISCVVDFFGPSDLGPGRRRVGQYILFGTRRPPASIYESASPAFLADSASPPFLILHGDSDRMVPVEHSRVLHEALTRVGVESRLCIFKGQPHAFIRPRRDGSLSEAAREAFQEVFNFLRVHLHGQPGAEQGQWAD
jgi:acetyl esterase/lipase